MMGMEQMIPIHISWIIIHVYSIMMNISMYGRKNISMMNISMMNISMYRSRVRHARLGKSSKRDMVGDGEASMVGY
jgi:uncharacterized membrane protein